MPEISIKKLYIIVFLTGAIVMILELIGSRIMAPMLGTSIFVWTSLIGIILGAMSLGYYLGGKFADKNPSLKNFSSILFVSGIFIFLIIMTKNPVLEISMFLGFKFGTIFASLVLFAIPGTFLGAVSPYAVRLAMKNVENSGNTVGNLYAVSTFGSIVGTFLAGFYLIPNFGSTNILYALAIMLFLISAFSYGKEKRLFKISASLLFFLGISLVSNAMENGKYLIDEDSAYNHIRVYDKRRDDGRMIRIMSVENFYDSGMFLDSDELAFEYSKYFRLDDVFKKNVKNVAIFGGAAYSVPKDFLARNKEGKIDVVEIDPRTTEIAKKFFNLKDSDRMNIYHQDARIFLNMADKNKYDVIYNDAFSSACAVPFHLTTLEALEKVHGALKDDGVYIMNLISAMEGDKSEFFRSEYKTLKKVFKNVYVFPVDATDIRSAVETQNIVMVALKQEADINEVIKNNQEEEAGKLLGHIWKQDVKSDDLRILTDDFSPVSYYAYKLCDY